MEKLKIKLENCYGIKKFIHDFDFSKFKTVAIYAPNGVMKTSFAKTLKAISKREKPCDQMDETLVSAHEFFTDDSNAQIDPEAICVIDPYSEEAFKSEGRILTLLADEKTRKEYLVIYDEIENLKKYTISGLKKISGSSNYETEIIESFSHLEKKNIFEIFTAILNDVKASNNSFDFKYNDVFDKGGKVKEFLENNFSLLEQYIEKYNDLIGKSTFFTKGKDRIFGTTEAKNLGDSLSGDEFFIAGHKLTLKSHGDIFDKKRLAEIINEEIERVFNDESLKNIFNKVDKALSANKVLEAFKKVIEKDNSILLRLVDYNGFRREVWCSFLKKIDVGLESLVCLYNSKKDDLERIVQKAKNGQSAWERAIEEFDNRFVGMPFTVQIKNKEDAVLSEETPALEFKFHGKNIERKSLIDNILSQGERRAFYLLNIIFEIKSRQLLNKKTLYIIDDIADSFDYKNKYAIIEYLNDLSKETNFYCIILSHNFDFFRTIQSRILQDHKWKYSFVAEKLENEIKLIDAGSRNVIDPFSNWRVGVNNNERHLIACIPFVRNLIDFKDGQNKAYQLLTHVLHYKEGDIDNDIKATEDVCINDLESIFHGVLSGILFQFEDGTKKIVDILYGLIEEIKKQHNSDSIVLEDKIILAIGSRLKAEKYMWSHVSNKTPILKNQTGRLFERYKMQFGGDEEHAKAIKTLESVNIITPDNIHLNSFMYEPILDMSICELKNLYDQVCYIGKSSVLI